MTIRRTIALSLLALAACDDDNSRGNTMLEDAGVVVATREADFSGSGAHSVIDIDEPFAASNQLDPIASTDLTVVGGAQHFYRLARFNTNTISRYDASAPDVSIYTYSTEGDEPAQSNPATLIEVAPDKAYLLRYGTGAMWIVDPGATQEADFKLGEIDLSHYDPDGVPEMSTAVLQGGLLYVGLQRLENFAATRSSMIAVIDITTDAEIDTRTAGSPAELPGIDLGVRNVTELAVVPGNGDVIALAQGGFDENFEPRFDGGIVRIDAADFSTTLLLDDGEPGAAPFGQLAQLAVAGDARAYFTGSPSFGSASLFRFDPRSGALANDGAAVAGLAAQDLGDIALDSRGRLWLARTNGDAPGLSVLNPQDQLVTALIDTVLVPSAIAFIQ